MESCRATVSIAQARLLRRVYPSRSSQFCFRRIPSQPRYSGSQHSTYASNAAEPNCDLDINYQPIIDDHRHIKDIFSTLADLASTGVKASVHRYSRPYSIGAGPALGRHNSRHLSVSLINNHTYSDLISSTK